MKSARKVLLNVLVVLPTMLFLFLGIRWLVDPQGIAPEFGYTLADGLGRSSQIGDMFGYFLTMSLCMLLGLVTGRKVWFYPAMMLLALTAIARVLAWIVHDATLAIQMIGIESVVFIVLLVASRYLADESEGT